MNRAPIALLVLSLLAGCGPAPTAVLVDRAEIPEDPDAGTVALGLASEDSGGPDAGDPPAEDAGVPDSGVPITNGQDAEADSPAPDAGTCTPEPLLGARCTERGYPNLYECDGTATPPGLCVPLLNEYCCD